MAKKTVGYVKLVWRCPNCNQYNPGPEKTCATCGSPQPEDVQFENPPQQEVSKDESLAKEVKKGADIHCPYCHTRNEADAVTCIQCGGDLVEGKQRDKGRIVGSPSESQGGQRTCPACGTVNAAGNLRCSSCGGSLVQQEPKPATSTSRPATTTPTKRSPAKTIGLIALIILLGIICVTIISFLTRTTELSGTVTGLSWQRNVAIEAIQPIYKQDWVNNVPYDAENVTCTERYYETRDYPSDNSIEVCGTPYTVDTGTGIGEVVQDCQYEIYMDYCEYTVLDWAVVDVVEVSGNNSNPYWPDLSLASDQREGSREESYQIVFSTDEGLLEYQTSNSSVFLGFSMGSVWNLDVGSMGGIRGYSPK